jgi:hypothetical protein
MRGLAAAVLGVVALILAAADAPPPLDRNDPNAVRCKRLAVTGSLVRKERTCRTNAEWKKISEQQNRDADDLMTRSRAGMDCRAGGGC